MKNLHLLFALVLLFSNFNMQAQNPILLGNLSTKNSGNVNGMIKMRDHVILYSATDADHGDELWITDGTPAGTSLLKDINPGTESSVPNAFVKLSDHLVLFIANDGVHGNELWSTDGTASGTFLVDDIFPGSSDSYIVFSATLNEKVFFSALPNDNSNALFITDGTSSGTKKLTDRVAPDWYYKYVVQDNTLYFIGTFNGKTIQLWRSDGTVSGNAEIKEIAGRLQTDVGDLVAFNGDLYFAGQDSSGIELWKSKGKPDNTGILKDIYQGSLSSVPQHLTVFNGKLFFSAQNLKSGNEIWTSDGTKKGTQRLKDIFKGMNGSFPNNFAVSGSYLYFGASDGTTGYQPWRTAGTKSGTIKLADIRNNTNGGPEFTSMNNAVYFVMEDSERNYDQTYSLWKSDGTSGGTILVDTNPFFWQNDTYFELQNVNVDLYFIEIQHKGQDLAATNGTIVQHFDFSGGVDDKAQISLVDGNDLYLTLTNDSDVQQLWKFTPTPFSPLKNEMTSSPFLKIYPNPANESFTINFTSASSSPTDISVSDFTGRTLLHENARSVSGSFRKQIDCSSLDAGIYFVEVKNGDHAMIGKLEVIK